jgi:hypothetical protein
MCEIEGKATSQSHGPMSRFVLFAILIRRLSAFTFHRSLSLSITLFLCRVLPRSVAPRFLLIRIFYKLEPLLRDFYAVDANLQLRDYSVPYVEALFLTHQRPLFHHLRLLLLGINYFLKMIYTASYSAKALVL